MYKKILKIKSVPLRFILIGFINFSFGYSVYSSLLLVDFDHKIALLLATIIGVVFNYFTSKKIIFQSRKKVIYSFVGIYALQYFFGILLLEIFISFFDNKFLAGFFVTAFLALVLYIPLSKIFYEKK